MESPLVIHHSCIMKTMKNLFILLLIVGAGISAASAQNSRNDKKAVKITAIKNDVDGKHYTFSANTATPLRGSTIQLTSEYDLRITPDSVISFLPYCGRAYMDVPYNPTDGGVKFSSTKFDYKVSQKKKGGWEITINPKDVKNLERLVLNISSDGYASLSVTSTNRDPISFYGYLKE